MFFPIIDEDKCQQCGDCMDVCPTDVMEMDEGVTKVANPADCLGCDSCIAVCEPEAIVVEEI